MSLTLSIIIPAYNEERRIRPTLEEYASHFASIHGANFEIVVIMNGCTDNTRGVVESVMAQHPQVRFLEYPDKSGKGSAIYNGFNNGQGELLAFADADNMVRPAETEKLLAALSQHDIAIGGRFGHGHDGDTGQSPLRKLSSASLRMWVRRYLGLPYQDTQCGAKAFRREAWQAMAPFITEKGWAFDLDVLSAAKALRLRVVEIPVAWKHVAADSKVQTWKAGPELLAATFRVKARRKRIREAAKVNTRVTE